MAHDSGSQSSSYRFRPTAEPEPIWREAPRYCPERQFPPYRFVAGLNPHPRSHPEGHARGRPEPELEYLPRNRWRENQDYLFGIDLYHSGYFWEAHEGWEGLWKQVDRHSAEGQFYQGLILLSAARIKLHARSAHGVRKTSWMAYQRLRNVLDLGAAGADGRFMGIDLPGLLAQVDRHYGAHWPDGSLRAIVLRGDPPRLELQF